MESIHYIAIALAVGVIVLTVVVFVLMSGRESTSNDERAIEPAVASSSEESSKPALLYFYSTTCPHAVRMTPEWLKAESALQGRFNVAKYLPDTEEFRDFMPHTNGGATPFVLLIKGDGSAPIPYNGDRSAESLIRFAESGGASS